MILNNFNFIKFYELEQVSLGLRFYDYITKTLFQPIFNTSSTFFCSGRQSSWLRKRRIIVMRKFWFFVIGDCLCYCRYIHFLNWRRNNNILYFLYYWTLLYFNNLWPTAFFKISWSWSCSLRINLKDLRTHYVGTNSFFYFKFINIYKAN